MVELVLWLTDILKSYYVKKYSGPIFMKHRAALCSGNASFLGNPFSQFFQYFPRVGSFYSRPNLFCHEFSVGLSVWLSFFYSRIWSVGSCFVVLGGIIPTYSQWLTPVRGYGIPAVMEKAEMPSLTSNSIQGMETGNHVSCVHHGPYAGIIISVAHESTGARGLLPASPVPTSSFTAIMLVF